MKTVKRVISVMLTALMFLFVAQPACFAGADTAEHSENCCSLCAHRVDPQAAVDEHDWGAGVETVPATCTEKGVMTYTCIDCGEEKTEAIAPKGHDPQIAPYVMHTCTEFGYAPFVCTRCGEIISKTDPEDPLGHDYKPVYTWAEDNGTVTAELTCTRCGDVSVSETVGVTRKVTAEPTCAKEGEVLYISSGFACKSFYVQSKTEPLKKLPHDITRMRQKSPTCTETGIDTYCVCNKCGALFEDEEGTRPLSEPPVLPKLPHTLYEIPAVKPTCTEPGVVAYFRCEMCGQYFADQNGTPAMFPLPSIPATGHEYKPVYTWAYDNSRVTAELTCAHCGDVSVKETVGVIKKIIVEPTCTQDGEALYTSEGFACKAFYVQTKTAPEPALGHDYKPVYVWAEDNSTVTAMLVCKRCGDISVQETVGVTRKVTVEPTCTHEGEVTYISGAFACKAFYVQKKTEPLNMLPHDTTRMRQKSPTCTETGIDTYCICNKCGGIFEDEAATKPLDELPVLPMLPHKLYEVPGTDPDCTSDGVTAHWRCEMCGQYFSDAKGSPAGFTSPDIPAKGHTHGEAVIENKTPATYTSDGCYDSVVYCTVCGAELSRETVVIPMPQHEHADRDNDGCCDLCEQMMVGGDHCNFCGKIHTGAFSRILIFFHRIFAFFKIKK